MSLFPLTQFDFPNVSAYDSDLREVLAILRGVTHEMKDFTVVNKITNAGAWDITKQYKPWTIVSDNNTGYISVRPVPAGIEITNTDYWALVADYDILITNLSERISALETSVSDIEKHVYRKYVFVSDSYGASVVPAIVTMLGLSSSDYVSIQMGGSSFGTAYENAYNWKTMIENTVTTDNDTYTDIVYIGGANESAQIESDITDHARSCYDYVKTRFPNSKQWYFFAGYFGGLNSDEYNLIYRVRLDRRLPQCISKTNRPFIIHEVWYPLADTRNLNADDLLHPTSDGATLIAGEICSCLFGGTAKYKTDCLETVELTSTHTVDWFFMTAYRENERVKGSIRTLHITLANNVQMLSTGTYVTIGTIPGTLIRGGYMQNGNTYDLPLGSALVQVGLPNGGGSRLLSGDIYLSPSNELKVRLTPAWFEAPGYYIDTVQIVYFNFEVSGYLN